MTARHATAIATQCKETTVHHIHKQRLCLHAKTITSDTKQSMCFLDQIRICVCDSATCCSHLMPSLVSCNARLCAGLFVFVQACFYSLDHIPQVLALPHALLLVQAQAAGPSLPPGFRFTQTHSCTNSSCHTSSYMPSLLLNSPFNFMYGI